MSSGTRVTANVSKISLLSAHCQDSLFARGDVLQQSGRGALGSQAVPERGQEQL